MTGELRLGTCIAVFLIHHFVHVSITTQKLWPSKVFQTFSRQIKRLAQEVGMVCVWVCQNWVWLSTTILMHDE